MSHSREMVSFKSQQILRSNAMGIHSSHSSYMQLAAYKTNVDQEYFFLLRLDFLSKLIFPHL
jgi:hypothetical protein